MEVGGAKSKKDRTPPEREEIRWTEELVNAVKAPLLEELIDVATEEADPPQVGDCCHVSTRIACGHATVVPFGPVEWVLHACLLQGSFNQGESLMRHQRRALAWMLKREKGQPAGGILADDQGLVRVHANRTRYVLGRQQILKPCLLCNEVS